MASRHGIEAEGLVPPFKGGIKAVTLLPSGRDYVGLFEENVQRLSQALKSGQ